jgi:hypothetical protein
MSRKTLYEDNRLTIIGGDDQALGKFLQVFDREAEKETPDSEGLVFEWSEVFGIETNLTGYPESMLPESIINNYIEEHFDRT